MSRHPARRRGPVWAGVAIVMTVLALLIAGLVLLIAGPAAVFAGSPGARVAVGAGALKARHLGSSVRHPLRRKP